MTKPDRPRWMGDNGHAKAGHPTIEQCPASLPSGHRCPAYLNHDGTGGLVCPDAADHCSPLTAQPY